MTGEQRVSGKRLPSNRWVGWVQKDRWGGWVSLPGEQRVLARWGGWVRLMTIVSAVTT
ncbi:MAG TPA: hypothetical protein VGK56_10760 [Anaerolineales bacterium]